MLLRHGHLFCFVFLSHNTEVVYLISLSWAENTMFNPNTRKIQESGILAGSAKILRFKHPTGIIYNVSTEPLTRNERGHWIPGRRMEKEPLRYRKSSYSLMNDYLHRGFSLALWKEHFRKKKYCWHPDAKPRAFYSCCNFSRELLFFLETQVEKELVFITIWKWLHIPRMELKLCWASPWMKSLCNYVCQLFRNTKLLLLCFNCIWKEQQVTMEINTAYWRNSDSVI